MRYDGEHNFLCENRVVLFAVCKPFETIKSQGNNELPPYEKSINKPIDV